MSDKPGYRTKTTSHDECEACGASVSRRGLARDWHLAKLHGGPAPAGKAPPPVAPGEPEGQEMPVADLGVLLGAPEMTKDEAMAHAAALIRDPSVPANQKGPLLSAMARVAGWETAPDFDFEKERDKWMANFRAMLKAKSATEGAVRDLAVKHKAAIPPLLALLAEASPK